METVKIKLEPRTITGKKVRRLRRQGYVPVHLYGAGGGSTVHQVEAKLLGKVLPQVGTNVPLMVEIEGRKEDVCFVRDVQRHPVSEDLLHVDFLRVDVSQTIQSEVPVIITGVAPAVVDIGGTLLQPLHSVVVESLPLDVPGSFSVDIGGLDDFEKAIYVRDIAAPPRVTILTDPDDMLARIGAPRIETEDAVLEEGEEPVRGRGAGRG